MYKVLLCWRYLRTRYLAMACIVSVMLGVATLIVVNSVMSGFSTKLRDRLHGLLSDIVVESVGIEGFGQPQEKMARIWAHPFLRDKIAAMTPTMEVFAMLQYQWLNGETVTRSVHLIGVDVASRAAVGGFAEHLVNSQNREQPSFELPPEVRKRFEEHERWSMKVRQAAHEPVDLTEPPPPEPPPSRIKIPQGVIVGNLIASFRNPQPKDDSDKDFYVLYPGDRIILTTVSGQRLAPVYDSFIVVDYFKSEMSEYDGNYVFVPLAYLQHLRTMPDRVTSIQIKLRDYRDAKAVVAALTELFPNGLRIKTWEDKQGALLQAIRIERGILNVLLFLIIAVAGFGILAIFSMIVAEKTRDIGILKALGASNGGVMKIFLCYGLLLGLVGALVGTVLGLTLTIYINDVEKGISHVTGQEIFDRTVYYFNEIPTDIQVWSVILVNLGAVAIAVVFSVLPALKAALLQPVRALRYE